jgi:hypothetical protein
MIFVSPFLGADDNILSEGIEAYRNKGPDKTQEKGYTIGRTRSERSKVPALQDPPKAMDKDTRSHHGKEIDACHGGAGHMGWKQFFDMGIHDLAEGATKSDSEKDETQPYGTVVLVNGQRQEPYCHGS